MARARRILARRAADSTAVASVRDFLVGPAREITLRSLFFAAPEALSPYALDVARERVAFVRTAPGVDPAEAHPFFYAAQRKHAAELVLASFDEVHALADDLAAVTMRFAFLYSAGRSGSTVAGKIAASLPSVQTLSEPDVFANLAMERRSGDGRREEQLVRIVRSTARIFGANRAAVDPQRRTLFIKQRGLGVFAAELVHRALPDARAVYLERDVAAVVDSYIGAFLAHPMIALGRRIGLDRLAARIVRAAVPYTHPWIARTMPGVVAAAPGSSDGAVEVLALAIGAMNDEIARVAREGVLRIDGTLRYEQLAADPSGFARELAVALGLPDDARLERSIASASAVREVDAQQGSSVRSRGVRSLSDDDVLRVRRAHAARVEAQPFAQTEAT